MYAESVSRHNNPKIERPKTEFMPAPPSSFWPSLPSGLESLQSWTFLCAAVIRPLRSIRCVAATANVALPHGQPSLPCRSHDPFHTDAANHAAEARELHRVASAHAPLPVVAPFRARSPDPLHGLPPTPAKQENSERRLPCLCRETHD